MKHIGHTPFSCPDCTKRFTTEKQMRRHLKEIHKKEKAEVSTSNSNPSGHFEVDPQAIHSPGEFLRHLESPDTLHQTNEFVLPSSLPQGGLYGSSSETNLFSMETDSWNVLPSPSSFPLHPPDGHFERFGEMSLDTEPPGVPEGTVVLRSPEPFSSLGQELEIALDSLSPEVGTNGTKIIITFVEPKGETDQRREVNFRCDKKGLSFQEEDAIFRSPSKLSLTFSAKDELLEHRVIQFDVTVPHIDHSPLAFTWVSPSTYEALVFLKAKGLTHALNDEDYKEHGKPCRLFFFFSLSLSDVFFLSFCSEKDQQVD